MAGQSRLASLLTRERFIAALGGMLFGAPLAVFGFMIVVTIVGSDLGLTNVRGIAAGGGVIGFILGFLREASP